MTFVKLIVFSLTPVLLLLLAALMRSTRAGLLRTVALAAVVLLAVLATPLVSAALLHQLERWPPRDAVDASSQGAQAIVVLAAEQRPRPELGGWGPGPLSLERLRYGADLAKRTGLPVLISGGDPEGEGVALADTLAQAMVRSFGVRATFRETLSLNTAENARNSAAMLKRRGVTRVLLVTHAWHMARAKAAFERAGLAVSPAPTAATGDPVARLHDAAGFARALIPQVGGLQTSYYAIHEMAGLVVLHLTPGA